MRRGGGGHFGHTQLSGGRGTVSWVQEDGGHSVARDACVQDPPDVRGLLVVVRAVPVPGPVPVIWLAIDSGSV